MALPQKKFGIFKYLYHGLTRSRLPIEDFKPYSIRVCNYYPSTTVFNGFEKHFGDPNEQINFTFNAVFPIATQCLVQSTIPSKLAGLIHLTSEFIKYSVHNWRLPCDIEVSIEKCIQSDLGIKYFVRTDVYQFKKQTLSNINVFLSKSKSYSGKKRAAKSHDNLKDEVLTRFDVSIKDARRYALISKDFNPIHLSQWLAKKLGMQRAVIHGMYNVHKVAGYLRENGWNGNYLAVEFNKPCFLPETVCLKAYEDDGEYGLFNAANTRRYVKFQTVKKEA